MTNDRDQALLQSAVADTATNLLAYLPSLGTGEAFAFGEGLALPTRLKFKQLPRESLPKSEIVNPNEVGAVDVDPASLTSVIERWRGGRVTKRQPRSENAADGVRTPRIA